MSDLRDAVLVGRNMAYHFQRVLDLLHRKDEDRKREVMDLTEEVATHVNDFLSELASKSSEEMHRLLVDAGMRFAKYQSAPSDLRDLITFLRSQLDRANARAEPLEAAVRSYQDRLRTAREKATVSGSLVANKELLDLLKD